MPEFKEPRGKNNKPSNPARTSGNKNGQTRSSQKRNNSGYNPNLNRKQNAKRKKRKNKQNNVIYYCMFAFLFVVIASALSVTVLFNAQEIAVEGESVYSGEEILAAAQIPEGVNLIRYNPAAAVENILDKLVYLDSAEIHKNYPSKLTVEVTGAEKMANILLPDGGCLLISKKGRILERVAFNTEQPVITGYEPVSIETGEFISSEDGKKTELIYSLISEAEKAEFDKITEINITDHLKIIITYDGRVRVIIGAAVDVREKLLAAKAIIAAEDINGNVSGTLNQTDPSKGYFLADIAAEGYNLFEEDNMTEDGSAENPEEDGEPEDGADGD